jgi:hypothetical protein
MRKGLALMVCVVFTIVAVAGLCWANSIWVSDGKKVQLVGKVVKDNNRFILKTDEGKFVLGGADLHSGADPSPWLDKKVKVSGEVVLNRKNPLGKRFKADKFEAAE